MKFENKYAIIYCKDNYYKEFNNNRFYNINNIIWYFRGYLVHREDGPALERKDGHKEWYKNGKLHRQDGPAVEMKDGTKMVVFEWNMSLRKKVLEYYKFKKEK